MGEKAAKDWRTQGDLKKNMAGILWDIKKKKADQDFCTVL